MTIKKHFPTIKYTSRDFNSIKSDLVDYAKRYYPDTFQDFNEAGFGSLMLDTVSYIGDILSFYLDYSVNESFLDTAIEYNNVLKLGRQLGYKFSKNPSSYGIANFYVIIPANANGMGPDLNYIPTLRRGTTLSSADGVSFMLNQDVSFANGANEVVVARVNNSTKLPSHYAIKASGQVMSGEIDQEIVTLGAFEQFLQIELSDPNIAQILSVIDSEGHEYVEVDYLSQDVIFQSVANQNQNRSENPALLKPVIVPRRFTVEKLNGQTVLQFGGGNEKDTTTDPIIDPASTVVKFHGRSYVSDFSFDPTNLLGTDTLGIAPSDTVIRIIYRTNNSTTVNVATNGLINVVSPLMDFDDIAQLNNSIMGEVLASLEVSNDSPISGDVTLPTTDELKIRIYDHFATQKRAVTEQDYISIIYAMPPEFGAIKRANIVRDADSFKRNLNVYTISESSLGFLETPNSTIKSNLKTWLNHNRMVNDTLDILDAKIVNIGINFVIVGDASANKFALLASAVGALTVFYNKKMEIGEPFYITDIYNQLNKIDGVVDTVSVKLFQKEGGDYSPTQFDLDAQISADGRYVSVPQNVIMEIKYPSADIKGSVK